MPHAYLDGVNDSWEVAQFCIESRKAVEGTLNEDNTIREYGYIHIAPHQNIVNFVEGKRYSVSTLKEEFGFLPWLGKPPQSGHYIYRVYGK